MSSKPKEEKTQDFVGVFPKLPWIPIFRKPRMKFELPTVRLPHRTPQNYIIGLLLLFSLFILAGGLYDLAENPPPIGATETSIEPIYRQSLNEQFLIESLAAGVFIGIGVGGFFLLRYATRYAYDPRYATSLLVLGIILMLVGLAGTTLMLDQKI